MIVVSSWKYYVKIEWTCADKVISILKLESCTQSVQIMIYGILYSMLQYTVYYGIYYGIYGLNKIQILTSLASDYFYLNIYKFTDKNPPLYFNFLVWRN